MRIYSRSSAVVQEIYVKLADGFYDAGDEILDSRVRAAIYEDDRKLVMQTNSTWIKNLVFHCLRAHLRRLAAGCA